MQDLSPNTILALAGQYGLPFVLVALLVVGLIRGILIPRWLFDREVKRADYWQAVAERLMLINHEQLEVARQAGQLAREMTRKIGHP